MRIRLPIGVSDYKKVATENYVYVDKSLFIKDIINDGAEVVLITRPRRFGKTLNLSMLRYFFTIEERDQNNIFLGSKIAKDKEFCAKYQNRYPVIFVSFKDVKKTNYESALEDIKMIYRMLYKEHEYLLEDQSFREKEGHHYNRILNREADESELQSAILNLSSYLHERYKEKVILLIDEYDTPLQEAYLATVKRDQDITDQDSYYNRMVILLRGILGQSLKDNIYLAKSVVTGITKVTQESMFSGLNNVTAYSMLHEQYGGYFGLLEEEVVDLIKRSQVEVSLDKIKEWYNGYKIKHYTLYNPWSIINCIANQGELRPYWLHTGGTALIEYLIGNSGATVKEQVEKLIQREPVIQEVTDNLVFSQLESSELALWSLLLYAGYLNVVVKELEGPKAIADIAIPNKEVWYAYQEIVEHWFQIKNQATSYKQFIGSLVRGDMEGFKNYIGTYILQSGSYFDFNQNSAEQVFHTFILGMIVGLRDQYIIKSNPEAGYGRADVMLLPRDKNTRGIIIEFKATKKIEELQKITDAALAQVKERQYLAIMKEHEIKSVLAIGLCFCGRELELAFEIIGIN